MTGFLIRESDGCLRGPNSGIVYKTQLKAEKAMAGWHGVNGKVVPVRINVINEQEVSHF